MDWEAAWARLRDLDDDAWDRESERLDALWKAEYRRVFVAFALGRRGWREEDASVWASEIVDEALIEVGGDPGDAARGDVVMCEAENGD